MSQEERFDTRERSYSAWHRRMSTRRFVGIEQAQTLAMIDLDASLYVEYDDGTKEPLALIETARDVGQSFKSASVTARLAEKAGIPAYALLYTLGNQPNPADPQWLDIVAFRYRRLYPRPQAGWSECSPAQWCEKLVVLRKWSASRSDKQWIDEVLSA